MNKLPEKIIKLRTLIVITVIIITMGLGYGIKDLKINSDITSYLKPDDPAMVLFNRIGKEYSGNLMVLVAIKTDEVFTYPVLSFINQLDENYSKIKGVTSITSIINMVDIKDTGDGIEVSKLIDKENIPKNKESLNHLKNYVMSKEIYKGKIVSDDSKTTLIICRLAQDANKIDIAREIKNVTEKMKGNYKVYYSGYPMEQYEMSRFLAIDLRNLIPIVILVIIIVLFISFKNIRGVLLPLTIVVISTVWTMGLMGYLGIDLSIVSNIIPVILLGLGTAYGIHFIARYYEDVTTEENKLVDIQKTIKHIGIPIILTALTTIAGFLSFTGAYITAISQFGIFTAVGVLFSLILSLTFLPAVLAMLKVKHSSISEGKSHFLKSLMIVISGLVVKKKKLITIITFSIFLIALFAIPNIKTQTQISDFFPKNSDIRKAEKLIKADFGGSTPVQIVIDGDIKDPTTLKKMSELEKYLDTLPYIKNPQSIADLITEMNKIVNGHKIIPAKRNEVTNLLFLLEGQEIMDQLVNKDYSEAIVQATFGSSDSKVVKETLKKINAYINKNMNGNYVLVPSDKTTSEIKKYLLGDTAKLVKLDIKKYLNNNIDISLIKNYLLKNYRWDGFNLTAEDENKLRKNLYTFFNEESEVIIDSQNDITKEVNAIIDYAKTKKVTFDDIVNLMYHTIPKKWWADNPGVIKSSAEFVYQKVINSQMNSYINVFTTNLLSSLLPNQNINGFIAKKISDDIYYLTYNNFGIPQNLLNNKTAQYKTIKISSVITGLIKIVERLNVSLIKSQVQSVIIAIIVVLLILSLQFKSLKVGLIVLSPIVFVILLNFAIMGYTNIPLDYATMLVGSILIGVGIDYSIHFSSRFKKEIHNSDNDTKNLKNTLTTTGVAIIINALMVALGFLVLAAGKLAILRREGWMIAVLMIISAFAAIIYLPSIFLLMKNKLNSFTKNNTKS